MFGSIAFGAILKKWWPVLAAALLFSAMLTLAYCNGRSAGKQGEVVKQQKREIQVQHELGRANSNAAASRVLDAVTAEQQRRELEDALHSTQDLDRQRIMRGCVIMRQQGRDLSRIPECRGS